MFNEPHLSAVSSHSRETGTDAVIICSEDGRILMADLGIVRLFTCPQAGVIGAHIEQVLPGWTALCTAASGGAGRAKGDHPPGPHALECRRADGRPCTLLVTTQPLVTGQGPATLLTVHCQTDTVAPVDEGIICYLENGIISGWDSGAERLLQYSANEMLGQSIAVLAPAYRRDQVPNTITVLFDRIRRGQHIEPYERIVQRRDGRDICLLLTIIGVRDPAGEVIGLSMHMRDNALRSMDEKRLQLAAIVESSDDAIISKTMQGVITSWNPGAEKLFGYTALEAIGQPMAICIPPERVGEEDHILERIKRGESIDHFDTVRLRKDGSRVEVSITISPIRDTIGIVVGASKIARDITERRQSEKRLQVQLERLDLLNRIARAIAERQDLPSIFQVVINSLEDHLRIDFCCACLYHQERHCLTVTNLGAHSGDVAAALSLKVEAVIPIDGNGLAQCLDGRLIYEPDTLQVPYPFPQRLAAGGLRALIAVPLQVESTAFGVIIAARSKEQSFSSGECEFLRQVGEHVALAAHQAQLHASLVRAYDDLHASQRASQQQERLRALGQMAAGIAHDINNALSPVALYTGSLLEKEPGLSVRTRKYLDIISRAVEDVAATIARLGEFYRPRDHQLDQVSVDVNKVVQHVIDLTRVRWSDMPLRRGVVITMISEAQPDLPAILGVASEVREAIINLVFNAVDAMPEGGTLTFRTYRCEFPATSSSAHAQSQVVVEVADTGIGMNEETRNRCLEPFFTTQGERGTGLGLAMVYGVARRHRATVDIETAVGVGTVMRLIFPIPTIAISPQQPSAKMRVPQRLRLLIVDDDPVILHSLRDTLEGDGHAVTAEHSSLQAIEVFRAALARGEPFAAVLTDLGMPHMDGRQLASMIKEASPATPVILLTGWGTRMVADGQMPEYVDGVLCKPTSLTGIRQALATCVPGG